MLIVGWLVMYLCMFSVRTFFNRFAFAKTLAVIIGAQILIVNLIIELEEKFEIIPDPVTLQFAWTVNAILISIAVVCLILGYYNLKRKRI